MRRMYRYSQDWSSLTGHVEDGVGYIYFVVVTKNERRTGKGSRMVHDFEAWAKDHGATEVVIDAHVRSLGFWESMGYTLSECSDENFRGIYMDGVKRL